MLEVGDRRLDPANYATTRAAATFALTCVVFAATATLAGYVLFERSQHEPARERIEVALTVIAGERGVPRGGLDDLAARLSGWR